MPGIRCHRTLPALLLAACFAHSPGPAAYAQAAKDKAAAGMTPAEIQKLDKYLRRFLGDKLKLTIDPDNPKQLEVHVGDELLGWVERDEDDDFMFEWYILQDELE